MNYPGFVGPSAAAQSAVANCERAMNWYVEPQDTQTGLPTLYPTPGQQLLLTVADVGTRALFTMNNRTFGLIGFGVYELLAGAVANKLGAVIQDGNLGYITMNGVGGNQAGFASGGSFYSLNLATNVLSAAIIPGEATQIGMIGSTGVAFNKTIGKVRISNLNDFLTWDPTQFALRSSAPDNWTAMVVNGADIWLIGDTSGDLWFYSGAFPFPLSPRQGVNYRFGCAATF